MIHTLNYKLFMNKSILILVFEWKLKGGLAGQDS